MISSIKPLQQWLFSIVFGTSLGLSN